MSTRPILLLLPFLLGLSACSLPEARTQTPENLSTATETPFQPVETTPLPELVTATPAPTLPPTIPPAMTFDQLRNGEYITTRLGSSEPLTYRLQDGFHRFGDDPTQANYGTVNLLDRHAFGDLNQDSRIDAVVLLVENSGGTGQFVQVGAVLDLDGKPVHTASYFLGDRVAVNNIAIQNRQIILDALVHGPQDGLCCPSVPASMQLQLVGNQRLMMTRFTTKTPGGQERAINIRAPLSGAEVSGTVTITGDVPIAPFENNLTYIVYDSEYREITRSWLMVDAPDMGAPGTFALTVDLAALGVRGNIYIEITDFSAADGSVLSMAQVQLAVR